MRKWVNNVIFTSLSALALIACGGGGGGNSTTVTTPVPSGGTPTPTPVTNSAPTANINVTNMAPNEGLTSTLDASGSSDSDGDTLTFSWTQLSGPDLVFSSPSAPTTDIAVPNLTADTDARIQLQVSDGTDTTTQEVTLSLTNLVLSPVANSTITNLSTLEYPNEVLALPTAAFFGTLNFLVYESGGQFIWDFISLNDSNILDTFQTAVIETNSADIQNTPFSSIPRSFASFSSDQVSFLDESRIPPELFSIDIANACAVISDTNFSAGNIIVGLRDGGAALLETLADGSFRPNGTGNELQRFGGNASFCEMQFTSGNSSLREITAGVGTRLLAFDENTNQIFNFSISRDNNGELSGLTEIGASTPVELDVPAGIALDLVASTRIDIAGARGLALVYSDGETEGNHRLVIIGLNGDGSISQDTHSWSYGTPTSIVHAAVEDHPGDSLFITTQDSPHAVIFLSGEILAGPTTYLPLTGPSFFDLGVGHGMVTSFNITSSRSGILTTFPDQNLITSLQGD